MTKYSFQVNLALSLAAGKGCAKNDTASALWFEKAADQGDMRAQRMIGIFRCCYQLVIEVTTHMQRVSLSLKTTIWLCLP